MAHYWCRLYAEMLHDPKIQKLPCESFKAWINALCLATEKNEGGNLGTLEEIAFAFHVTVETVSSAFHPLLDLGLIETDGETFHIPKFQKRQYKSDSSTERVRKHRKRSKNVSETPRARDRSDTDTDPPIVPPQGEDRVFERWNELADQSGLPKARALSADRRRKLKARIKEHGVDGVLEAVENIHKSAHCRGSNPRGWRADFEFLLQAKSCRRAIEEGYGSQNANGPPGYIPLAGPAGG